MSIATQDVDPSMTTSRHDLVVDMPEPQVLLNADAQQLGHAMASVVQLVGDSCERPARIGVTVRHGNNLVYVRIRRVVELPEPDFVRARLSLRAAGGPHRSHGVPAVGPSSTP